MNLKGSENLPRGRSKEYAQKAYRKPQTKEETLNLTQYLRTEPRTHH